MFWRVARIACFQNCIGNNKAKMWETFNLALQYMFEVITGYLELDQMLHLNLVQIESYL